MQLRKVTPIIWMLLLVLALAPVANINANEKRSEKRLNLREKHDDVDDVDDEDDEGDEDDEDDYTETAHDIEVMGKRLVRRMRMIQAVLAGYVKVSQEPLKAAYGASVKAKAVAAKIRQAKKAEVNDYEFEDALEYAVVYSKELNKMAEEYVTFLESSGKAPAAEMKFLWQQLFVKQQLMLEILQKNDLTPFKKTLKEFSSALLNFDKKMGLDYLEFEYSEAIVVLKKNSADARIVKLQDRADQEFANLKDNYIKCVQ